MEGPLRAQTTNIKFAHVSLHNRRQINFGLFLYHPPVFFDLLSDKSNTKRKVKICTRLKGNHYGEGYPALIFRHVGHGSTELQ